MGVRSALARFRSFVGAKADRGGGSPAPEAARPEAGQKDGRLKRLRGQVAERDRELERLRAELADLQRERRLPRFFEADAPVFFVVGQGKSGTTWLRNLLNAHPEVLCRGEGRFFERDFVRAAPLEDLERGWLKSVQPTSLYGAISSSEPLRTWVERSVWTDGQDVEEHLDNLMRLSTHYFLTRRLSETDKKIVGDKTTFSSGRILHEIGAIYPEAKVIHIIRDGRDAAVSMIHHMWNYSRDAGAFYNLEPEELEKRDVYRRNPDSTPPDGLFAQRRLTSIARTWAVQVDKAVEDGPALLGDNYAEVRYEDLLESPEDEIRRLLLFLGADAGGPAVERCIEESSFERWSEGRGRGSEESSSFYRKGVAGDWKNVFTEADKETFKRAAGGTLVKLGYETGDDW